MTHLFFYQKIFKNQLNLTLLSDDKNWNLLFILRYNNIQVNTLSYIIFLCDIQCNEAAGTIGEETNSSAEYRVSKVSR